MTRPTVELIEAIARQIWGHDGWQVAASLHLNIRRRNLQRWRAGTHEPDPKADAEIRGRLSGLARAGAKDLSLRVEKLGVLCAELQEKTTNA